MYNTSEIFWTAFFGWLQKIHMIIWFSGWNVEKSQKHDLLDRTLLMTRFPDENFAYCSWISSMNTLSNMISWIIHYACHDFFVKKLRVTIFCGVSYSGESLLQEAAFCSVDSQRTKCFDFYSIAKYMVLKQYRKWSIYLARLCHEIVCAFLHIL